MDFVVLNMEEDLFLPIILGRPFIAIACVMINVKNGKLKLQVEVEEIEFELNEMVKYSSFTYDLSCVDITHGLTQNYSLINCKHNPLESCLLNSGMSKEQYARFK